jgi:hypothetical protein
MILDITLGQIRYKQGGLVSSKLLVILVGHVDTQHVSLPNSAESSYKRHRAQRKLKPPKKTHRMKRRKMAAEYKEI